MTKPTVVVFDLGKVLLDFAYGRAATKISALCSDQTCDVRRILDQSPLLHRFESGSIGSQEFFHEVRALTGFKGSEQEFGLSFADIFSPIPEMIDAQAALKTAGIPTYIFSNTNDLAVAHIRATYPFFANFDGYIFSYEHGAMKPDPRIYAVVEKMTGCQGTEILYIDDREENVEGGSKRGWQVIFHQRPEPTIARLTELGLLPA